MSRDLPHNTCGLYDDWHRLILLADWLNPRQEYCTLVHELIHAWHHDPGCGTSVQRQMRAPSAASGCSGRSCRGWCGP
ncbi:ImmA/IrrE family metallo-endopeptidase [Bifidobacterium dentium]|uniref:ImmA/IrrE family metallo-endopeptidase n=1 Tax=Bifidobacterium dentium TaxID=1689 RepID=UPI0030C6EF53